MDVMGKILYMLLTVFAAARGRKYTGSTNQAGIDIIKKFEGFHPNFCNDSAGHYYIGYGYVCRHPSSCVIPLRGKYDVPLTLQSAEALLREDLFSLGGSEPCVNDATTYRHLNSNQFSALVSFAQNMGCGTFRNSFLRNSVNRGDLKEAENDFRRYVYVKGRKRDKLVRRREAERKLFSSGVTAHKGVDCFGLGHMERNAKKGTNFIVDLFLSPILELCKKLS